MSTIKLINGSSVDQEVDAIVNAANKYLAAGGGVCGEIFKRAGYIELSNACKRINTPLNTGDAVITDSFNIINTKYIIHAVGPNFNDSNSNINELYLAYKNSLKVLKENNLHTISFPLISSGIFGGNLPNPARSSTEQCLKAYNDFIKENDYNIDVILCAYSKKEYQEARSVFNNE